MTWERWLLGFVYLKVGEARPAKSEPQPACIRKQPALKGGAKVEQRLGDRHELAVEHMAGSIFVENVRCLSTWRRSLEFENEDQDQLVISKPPARSAQKLIAVSEQWSRKWLQTPSVAGYFA